MRGRRQIRRAAVAGVLAILLLASWKTWARPFQPPRPAPDLAEIRYGPHERNVLDIWKAIPKPGQAGPTPLVVYFHGGGFRSGDKSSVPVRLIMKCRDAGISVASANYRLSATAPYPAPMIDGARAIQFLRSRAQAFGIDPSRIAASGNSAGGGIALWVGFHDDLADPKSDDPILRESSRVSCLGVDGAQTSYDPRFIKPLIGGRAHEHPAFRKFYAIRSAADWESPAFQRLFEDASPLNHVSAGDPPSILFYTEPKGPLPSDALPGDGIHHPLFGAALKAVIDPLGIECIVKHEDDYPMFDDHRDDSYRDMVQFFERQLSSDRSDRPVRSVGSSRRPAGASPTGHRLRVQATSGL
jgi:acetyl esterase